MGRSPAESPINERLMREPGKIKVVPLVWGYSPKIRALCPEG